MEAFMTKQNAVLGRIDRSFQNFKKEGAAKMTVGACKVRMANLDNCWDVFTKQHNAMVDQKDVDLKHSYFVDDEFGQTEETYLKRKGEFQDFLEKSLETKTFQSGNYLSSIIPDDRVKLPPIDLPTFSGNFCDWRPFKDLFTSMVLDRTDLSQVAKLHYLQSHVKGEAADLICCLPTTNENLTLAWGELQAQYENTRRLVNAQISAIFSLKPVQLETSNELKRLKNGMAKPLSALEALQRPVNQWDDLIVFLVVSRLDSQSRKEWENLLGSAKDPPTLSQLNTFLSTRIMTLEALELSERKENRRTLKYQGRSSHTGIVRSDTYNTKVHQITKLSTTPPQRCILCAQPHFILYCDKFKAKSSHQKRDFVKANNLCFNCLSKHLVKNCRSAKRCQKCQGKHHTTLHLEDSVLNTGQVNVSDPSTTTRQSLTGDNSSSAYNSSTSTVTHLTRLIKERPETVLLATALVYVMGPRGDRVLVRAIIDQCSQSSFITESLCQRLKLIKQSVSIPIVGVGNHHQTTSHGLTSFQLMPRFTSSFNCHIEALVLSKVSSYQPPSVRRDTDWQFLENLELADPYYLRAGSIDLLLGASVHAQIVEGEVVRGMPHEPMATKTKLGWVISGGTSDYTTTSHMRPTVLHCTAEVEVDQLLQRFWLQEELSTCPKILSPEDLACEDHFRTTHSRNRDGRYTVRLPLKNAGLSLCLGDSYSPAVKMLQQMEKRFLTNSSFHAAYNTFMQEYHELGHMRVVKVDDPRKEMDNCFFLPHHGVMKESSITTKLRVVFNGSFKTNMGISVNDMLYVGPNLLPEIADIVFRWRTYRVAFVADIEKMYRQIRVHDDDQQLQSIVWRADASLPIKTYRLTTVTYGLNSSPYLANRVLNQLAEDEEVNFPLGAEILRQEIYMDDVLSGSHCLDSAISKQKEIIGLCKAGGFSLRKWLSNEPLLLQGLPDHFLALQNTLLFESESSYGVLGLKWQPLDDYFHFEIKLDPEPLVWTKRVVLSKVAKLFDPLGWLAPTLISAKILMQRLWLLKLNWDDELPEPELKFWRDWYNELPQLSCNRVPRWLGFNPKANKLELHGFADASKLAYGAVIYLRTVTGSDIHIGLIQAKTKVAPIKVMSIPRLELSAAHLLAKLVHRHLSKLDYEGLCIHLWSDSMDILYWLRAHPSRWSTFVANRCADIHTWVPAANWHHLPSDKNPADPASRGVNPAALSDLSIWWKGPRWLHGNERYWPITKIRGSGGEEFVKHTNVHHMKTQDPSTWDLSSRYSSLNKLLRVTGFCLRFLCPIVPSNPELIGDTKKSLFSYSWMRLEGTIFFKESLATQELERARLLWVYLTQRAAFATEIGLLDQGKTLPKKSPLSPLNPILEDGLLRVGGRIKHSLLSFDQKHPLILPGRDKFTTLLINAIHMRTLHGGTQLTLTTIRTHYWVIKGRQAVKAAIQRCLPCLRYRASSSYQMMGNLPICRVQPSRPFSKAGVDYAGPILIRTSPGRGCSSYKGYIAVFVCLCTRAVHLEAVSSYSTEGFLAAFRRFTARRGHCAVLYSDQGTNFVGADKELRLLYRKSSVHSQSIKHKLADAGTDWRYNPPAAPHFGGIWEAAVKSVKHHLKRVIGETRLTYEELSTLLSQVEACLNSRPLLPLSDDPTDLQALTPAHFLIQTYSYVVPEPDLLDENIPFGRRWKLIQQMLQHFWYRWSTEYLQTLQPRSKWRERSTTIQPGQLVLLHSDKTTPARWPLARVMKIHPGDDGLVRVVTVRTADAVLKRPITKLICLKA